MAAITTSSAMISAPTLCVSAAGGRTNRRRHIDPKTGHALEILGHAIEYLTDEFVHEAATFSAGNEKLKAVQLLMTLNETTKNLFHLRLQAQTERLDAPSELRKQRRMIARIKTVQNQRATAAKREVEKQDQAHA